MKTLILYIAKCLTGGLIVYALSSIIHYTDISWCMISVMLVISPDSSEAVPLAMTRIKANLTGSASSYLCLLLGPANPFTVCVAFVTTIVLCFVFKVMAGARSALAAAIIVMLHGNREHLLYTSLERVLSVIIGCALGLLVTLVFHSRLIGGSRQPKLVGE